MEGDANLASITYENIISQEDPWANCQDVIWLLGKKYEMLSQKEEFLKHVKSLLWFTYRRNFSSIGGTGPTSDAGWGCMMRCGQMVLGHALVRLAMGDEWRWTSTCNRPSPYIDILEQFMDERSSCYSIQQIVQMGVEEGKSVGSWFGPNTVAQVLKRLSSHDKLHSVSIYVAMDNTICIEDVESQLFSNPSQPSGAKLRTNGNSQESNSAAPKTYAQCANGVGSSQNPSQPHWRPLVIFVPLRLGLSTINQAYFHNLKKCFHWKQCIGIIGGKPNHAYYFIGYTSSNHLVFLDPHSTQMSLVHGKILDDSSYHCSSPSRMQISQLDPSLAACFVCRTRHQFEDLCSKVKQMKRDKETYPLFEVVDSMPSCNVLESRIVSVSRHNRDKHKMPAGNEDNFCLTLDSDEDIDDIDEEFEILEIH